MLGLDPSAPGLLGLGLLGLGLCALGLAALIWRRSGRRRAGGEGFGAQGLARALLFVTLAGAVLGLEGGAGPGARTRVVVLDRSRSLSGATPQSDGAAAKALEGWSDPRPGDRVALVTCGAQARVVLEPVSPEDAKPRLAELLAIPTDDWGTDLRGALRLASGLLPPRGGEVFVISDGRDGAAEEGVSELLARGVPVHAFAPRAAALPGLRVASFGGPQRVARGAEVLLRVGVQAARPTRGELILEVREGRAWREVSRRELSLSGAPGPSGLSLSLELPWTAPGRGAALTLRARVRAQGPDRGREDDVLEHSLLVGRSRQVVVCGRPLPGLASRTLSVTSVRPSELARILESPPELLVLSEVSAAAVQDAVPALEAALEGGMGLAVCGLEAFGPGGYAESPLEELLPARSGPAEERADRLALVVCLDASGSMARPAGQSRYLQAVEAGVPWDTLRPEDSLGVILFADQPRVIAPLGPLGPQGDELRMQLVKERLSLGGGTNLAAALGRGLELVGQSRAEERVLVLASDAEDDPQADLGALAAQAQGLVVPPGAESPRILLIGIEARSLKAYEALAKALEPHPVEVVRARDAGASLRSLLQSEIAARRHSVRKGRFKLSLEEPGRARQLFLPESLAAYVPVRARQEPSAAAQVLGRVEDPAGGEGPWAVLGRRGRGRVAVIPLAGPVAAPLISGLAGELLRPREDSVRLEVRGQDLWLTSESQPLPAGVRVEARAGGGRWDLALVPEGPRRARARLVRREPLETGLQLSALAGPGPTAALLATCSLPPRAHDELVPGEPNYELLTHLTRASGGVLLAGPNAALPLAPPATPRPYAPLLAGLAALLVLLELAWGGLRSARARARLEPSSP